MVHGASSFATSYTTSMPSEAAVQLNRLATWAGIKSSTRSAAAPTWSASFLTAPTPSGSWVPYSPSSTTSGLASRRYLLAESLKVAQLRVTGDEELVRTLAAASDVGG